MEAIQEYWPHLLVSNVVALIILWAAIKRTRLARLLFVLLFAWACWLNFRTAHNDPSGYLEYASLTPFPFYEQFINGWFASHVTEMVTAISIGQGLIALGMLLNGMWVRLACIGASIFFLAITPLGIGSGFPFPLIGILAAWFILEKDGLNFLWKRSEPRYFRYQAP